MRSNNLLNDPYIQSYKDQTENSVDYVLLNDAFTTRAKATFNFIKRRCFTEELYKQSEMPEEVQTCVTNTLTKLTPLMQRMEQVYTQGYNNMFDQNNFVDMLTDFEQKNKARINGEDDSEGIRNPFYERFKRINNIQ